MCSALVVDSSAFLQMTHSPTKKKTIAKKSDKKLKMDNTKFKSLQHFKRYRDFYLRATIIQERFVDFMDLKDTIIPSYFEGRGWERLLSDLPGVSEPLIREFYANAMLREDELNCWIRAKKFTIDASDIDNVLGLEGLDDHDFTNYKDRMLSIETIQYHIGGAREGRCLNTTTFPTDMRCLTNIMMFNLYPVRKLTTINNAKAIFLMELKENTFINISSHIFDTIVDETRTTSRAKLIFPSLLIRLFRLKGVAIPQDISLMPTPLAIDKLSITRIQVRLPSDEDEGDQGKGEPMETKTEATGEPSSSRGRGKRSRASSSSVVPPDAFQRSS